MASIRDDISIAGRHVSMRIAGEAAHMKKLAALLLFLSLAAPITMPVFATPVNVGGPWYEFSFTSPGVLARGCAPADALGLNCRPGPAGTEFAPAPPWTFASGQAVILTMTDAFIGGDAFNVFDFGVFIGSTPFVLPGVLCGDDPNICVGALGVSHARFILAAGQHSITIVPAITLPVPGAAYFRLAVPEPASLSLIAIGLVAICAVFRTRSSPKRQSRRGD
jgi:PEP-CTERM motif